VKVRSSIITSVKSIIIAMVGRRSGDRTHVLSSNGLVHIERFLGEEENNENEEKQTDSQSHSESNCDGSSFGVCRISRDTTQSISSAHVTRIIGVNTSRIRMASSVCRGVTSKVDATVWSLTTNIVINTMVDQTLHMLTNGRAVDFALMGFEVGFRVKGVFARVTTGIIRITIVFCTEISIVTVAGLIDSLVNATLGDTHSRYPCSVTEINGTCITICTLRRISRVAISIHLTICPISKRSADVINTTVFYCSYKNYVDKYG